MAHSKIGVAMWGTRTAAEIRRGGAPFQRHHRAGTCVSRASRVIVHFLHKSSLTNFGSSSIQ
jgi:hypothetical protein